MNSNSIADMLAIAKAVARGSFGFNTEIVVRTLVFVKKIHIGHTISVQNPLVQRHFMSKIEVCGATGLSGLSLGRDLANPLGVEPLSL